MIFEIPRTSTAAYAALSQIGAQLSGQKQSIPFAQAHDDGTLEFPDLDPSSYGEPREKQDEDSTTGDLVGARVQRNLTMAFLRDAQHATASRGQLLLHGAQTRLLGFFEAGNQLSLVFK